MRSLRVMLIDTPGFSRDVIAALIRDVPGVRLAAAEPGAVVVDDRRFADALPFIRDGVPTIVLGLDDAPGFAERAQEHGALRWMPKDAAQEGLPELLAGLVAVARPAA